jgi:hypothetical protein
MIIDEINKVKHYFLQYNSLCFGGYDSLEVAIENHGSLDPWAWSIRPYNNLVISNYLLYPL